MTISTGGTARYKRSNPSTKSTTRKKPKQRIQTLRWTSWKCPPDSINAWPAVAAGAWHPLSLWLPQFSTSPPFVDLDLPLPQCRRPTRSCQPWRATKSPSTQKAWAASLSFFMCKDEIDSRQTKNNCKRNWYWDFLRSLFLPVTESPKGEDFNYGIVSSCALCQTSTIQIICRALSMK